MAAFHLGCVWQESRSTLFTCIEPLCGEAVEQTPLTAKPFPQHIHTLASSRDHSYLHSFTLTPPVCSYFLSCLEISLMEANLSWDSLAEISLACSPSSLTALRGITAFFQGFSLARPCKFIILTLFDIFYKCLPTPRPEKALLIIGPQASAIYQLVDAKGCPLSPPLPYTLSTPELDSSFCFTDDISLADSATYLSYYLENPATLFKKHKQ